MILKQNNLCTGKNKSTLERILYENQKNTVENIRIFDEDIICVNRKKKNPYSIDQSMQRLATNIIADDKEGRQTWIGKVIGKTQHYIHFRDNSKRRWVNVKGWENNLEINDYLALDIMVEKLPTGERRVSAMQVMKFNPVE